MPSVHLEAFYWTPKDQRLAVLAIPELPHCLLTQPKNVTPEARFPRCNESLVGRGPLRPLDNTNMS